MLVMAEVTSEMGAELRASALAAGTSVAAEVGRRLERLDRLEASFNLIEAEAMLETNSGRVLKVVPISYRFADKAESKSEAWDELERLRRTYGR